MPTGDIDTLIQLLSRLPGLGKRSARRMVLTLVKNKEATLLPLLSAMQAVANSVQVCAECGNVDDRNLCHVCTDERRNRETICVVEEAADLWAIERSSIYRGLYHVLGGTLSALDGIGPEDLHIEGLIHRATTQGVTEVILATNATVDGQMTAHYIMERLRDTNIKLSKIAHGVPVGGELDYLDEGTLSAAMKARQPVM